MVNIEGLFGSSLLAACREWGYALPDGLWHEELQSDFRMAFALSLSGLSKSIC